MHQVKPAKMPDAFYGSPAPKERPLKVSSKFGQARGVMYMLDRWAVPVRDLDPKIDCILNTLLGLGVNRVAVLHSLMVAPGHREKGCGGALLCDFLDFSSRNGAGVTLVHACNIDPVAPVDNPWLMSWFSNRQFSVVAHLPERGALMAHPSVHAKALSMALLHAGH